jgi:hypothetical protein
LHRLIAERVLEALRRLIGKAKSTYATLLLAPTFQLRRGLLTTAWQRFSVTTTAAPASTDRVKLSIRRY